MPTSASGKWKCRCADIELNCDSRRPYKRARARDLNLNVASWNEKANSTVSMSCLLHEENMRGENTITHSLRTSGGIPASE